MRRTQGSGGGQTLYFHFQESAFHSKNTAVASMDHSCGPFKQDHKQVRRDSDGATAGLDHPRTREHICEQQGKLRLNLEA